ncbi:unnamed protein product [Chrysoparadoxa australica]
MPKFVDGSAASQELVIECITTLSEALAVLPTCGEDSSNYFYPAPPPKLAMSGAEPLEILTDLLVCNEIAVLEPALALLIQVCGGGFSRDIQEAIPPLAMVRLVLLTLKHACAGRCLDLCGELLTTEAIVPILRGRNGVERESAMLALCPLYPLLPGALVRVLATQESACFVDVFMADHIRGPELIWNSGLRSVLAMTLQHVDASSVQALTADGALDAIDLSDKYLAQSGEAMCYIMPYYLDLITEDFDIAQPAMFLREIGASLADFVARRVDGVRLAVPSVSTPLTKTSELLLVAPPLLWTLRQHASAESYSRRSSSKAKMIAAMVSVVVPLIKAATFAADECKRNQESFGAVAPLVEALSVLLIELAQAKRLTAFTDDYDDEEDDEETEASKACVDFNALHQLLACVRALQDNRSSDFLMQGINSALKCLADEHSTEVEGSSLPVGLADLVGSLVQGLDQIENFPRIAMSAMEGITLATEGFSDRAGHVDLLFASQVFAPLLVHCLKNKQSSPGKLTVSAAAALHSLANRPHQPLTETLKGLLKPGLVMILQRSAQEFLDVLMCPIVENSSLIWNTDMKRELLSFLNNSPTTEEMAAFEYESLSSELCVQGVYIRALVEVAMGEVGEFSTQGENLGRNLPLPPHLLAYVFLDLSHEMQSVISGHVNFRRVGYLMKALVGLAVGGKQVEELLRDCGDYLGTLWEVLPPTTAAHVDAMETYRTCLQLIHLLANCEQPGAAQSVVSSGVACPLVCLCSHLLVRSTSFEGLVTEAALFIIESLAEQSYDFRQHLFSCGAVPFLLSQFACTDLSRDTRLKCGRVLHKMCSLEGTVDALERLLPVPLLLHLQDDPTSQYPLMLLDSTIESPLLLWAPSCRQRMMEVARQAWLEWEKSFVPGVMSYRWTPDYLPEELFLPPGRSSETSVAGVYLTLYNKEPDYYLEIDLVEDLLTGGLDVIAGMQGKSMSQAFLPVLLESIYHALSSVKGRDGEGSNTMAQLTKNFPNLWPCLFSTIYGELGISNGNRGTRPRAVGGRMLLLWAARLCCLLTSVPTHWNLVGAAKQLATGSQVTAVLGSCRLSDDALQLFLCFYRALAASKLEDGLIAATNLGSREVLTLLVGKWTAFSGGSSANLAIKGGDPGEAVTAPSSPAGTPVGRLQHAEKPMSSNTEGLTIRLLATLAAHAAIGAEVRKILREICPVRLYQTLQLIEIRPSALHDDLLALLPSPTRPLENHMLYIKPESHALYLKPHDGDVHSNQVPQVLRRPLRIELDEKGVVKQAAEIEELRPASLNNTGKGFGNSYSRDEIRQARITSMRLTDHSRPNSMGVGMGSPRKRNVLSSPREALSKRFSNRPAEDIWAAKRDIREQRQDTRKMRALSRRLLQT